MENDDQQVGQILTRREALVVFGAAGAALLAACTPDLPGAQQATSLPAAGTTVAVADPATATTLSQGATAALPACVVRPEMAAGPFFVDEKLNRSDIRPDPASGTVSAGIPLELTFVVAQVGAAGCTPLAGAAVDVWHCDAAGVYSDVQNAVGQQFLRGYQVTDETGLARFKTIYPGWYPGRAVHIHFKIRLAADSGAYDFTSQLFFDDAISDAVHALVPYSAKGPRDRRNADEGIFNQSGDQLLLALTTIEEGYAADFEIGLQI